MALIIKGGSIVDGTGAKARPGDIRIDDGTITWVGEGGRDGAEVLDASGKTVCPGFIDFHSHTDMTLLVNPTAESKLAQGVTLEVCGNCGSSDAPILDPEAREHARKSLEKMGASFNWGSMGEMLDALEQAGTGVNFCTYVGHGNVRREVVGREDRPATPEELARMRDMVAQCMDEGAVGISTGLIYPPSCYGSTGELVELCKPVGQRGGLYSTHMRSESKRLTESVAEAIEIGERSGAAIQISHLKACGISNHGKAIQALEMIEEARGRGVNVSADQYPYIATSTSLDTMIPEWAHSGGSGALRARLEDSGERQRIVEEIRKSNEPGGWISDSGGFDSVVISGVRTDENRWTEGLTLTEIVSKRTGRDPVEAMLDFLLEEDFGIGMVHFCLSETDVKAVMRTPYTLFGSDATARATSGPMGKGKPHPRAFGTFARILAHYVREGGVIPLETAIQKMTSLAADRLGLKDRGRLASGAAADIVVFDPGTVRDTATFKEPKQLAEGIAHVLVNGEFALRDSQITGALHGQVIRGIGARH